MFADLQRELSRLWRSLAAALDRAGRELADEAARRGRRVPRAAPVPTRLPPPRVRRPAAHPLLLPVRLRAAMPAGILDRQRRTQRRPPSFGQTAGAGAGGVAGLVRQQLLALQTALRGLQQRLEDSVGRRR